MESNIPAEYPSKPWQLLFDYLSGLCEIPPTLSEMEDLINVVEKMIGHKALQAHCDRYEKALRVAHQKAKDGIFPDLPVETMAAQKCIEIDIVLNEALNGGEEKCSMCNEKPKGEHLTVCNDCYQSFDGDRRGFWTSDVYQ